MDKEIWKEIKDYPDYEVSNHGRIRSLDKDVKKSFHVKNGKPTKDKNYPKVEYISKRKGKIIAQQCYKRNNKPRIIQAAICKNGKQYHVVVSRLVLTAFRGDPLLGQEACHNDGNPTNNHIYNLRWDTHKNNMNDRHLHGTFSKPPNHKGKKHRKTIIKSNLKFNEKNITCTY